MQFTFKNVINRRGEGAWIMWPRSSTTIFYKVTLRCKLTSRGCFMNQNFIKQRRYTGQWAAERKVGVHRGGKWPWTGTGAEGPGDQQHQPPSCSRLTRLLSICNIHLLWNSTSFPPLIPPTANIPWCSSMCKPLFQVPGRGTFAPALLPL